MLQDIWVEIECGNKETIHSASSHHHLTINFSCEQSKATFLFPVSYPTLLLPFHLFLLLLLSQSSFGHLEMLLKLLFAASPSTHTSSMKYCILLQLFALSHCFHRYHPTFLIILLRPRENTLFSNTFCACRTMSHTIYINLFERLFTGRTTIRRYMKEDCFDYCSALLKCIVKVYNAAQSNQVTLIRKCSSGKEGEYLRAKHERVECKQSMHLRTSLCNHFNFRQQNSKKKKRKKTERKEH